MRAQRGDRQPPCRRRSTASGTASRTVIRSQHDGGRVPLFEGGEVVCFCSSEWHNASVSPFYPPDAGNHRFRISASAIQSGGKPVTFR
jgi:hypothetical protein